MVTMKDVAKMAGVSLGTVSNFVNKTHPVSTKKEQAILEAIKILNYEVNDSAKNLRSKKTSEIGLIIPNISNPYYQSVLRGAESYITSHGYTLALATTNDDPVLEKKIVKEMLRKQVAGLIITSCQPYETAFFKSALEKNDTPIAFIDRKIHGLACNFLGCDCRKSIFNFTSRLLIEKKDKILFLGGPIAFFDQKEAFEGYKDAFASANCNIDENLVCFYALNKEEAFARTFDLISKYPIDAIVTTSIDMAFGALSAVDFFHPSNADSITIFSLGEDTWSDSFSQRIITSKRPAIRLGGEAAATVCKQISFDVKQQIVMTLEDGKSISKCFPLQYQGKGKSINLLMLDMAASKTLARIIPAYEQQTGITVNLDIVNHEHYYSHVSKRLHDDSSLDVVLVDMPWVNIFVREKLIEDITDYIKFSNFDTSIYIEDCMNRLCNVKHRTYGLPILYTPQVLFYRKDLFNDKTIQNAYKQRTDLRLRPPFTWYQYNSIANFFTKELNPDSETDFGTSIAFKHNECFSSEIRVRMRTFGGRIFDEKDNVIFNSSENIKAFSSLIESLKYSPQDFRKKDRTDIENDLIDGNVAMIVTFQSILNKALDNHMSNNIGAALVPGQKAMLGGWCLCINRNSLNKENAFDFIKWAAGNDSAPARMILSGQSVQKDIIQNDELNFRNVWLKSWEEAYADAGHAKAAGSNSSSFVPVSTQDEVLFATAKKIIDENVEINEAVLWGENEFRKHFAKL